MRNDRRRNKASNILGEVQTVEKPQPFEPNISERESISDSDDEEQRHSSATLRCSVAGGQLTAAVKRLPSRRKSLTDSPLRRELLMRSESGSIEETSKASSDSARTEAYPHTL